MPLKKSKSRNEKVSGTKKNVTKINIEDRKEDNKVKRAFPIVAIGASAGGLEAFGPLFTHMPANSDIAFVVITHLNHDRVNIAIELIKKYTTIPVYSIKNGTRLIPNTIYVIPSDMNVAVKQGILRLIEKKELHYENLPINFFFQSLAEDNREKVIAIILSGSGTDGSLGLRAIKREGGITIVQDPLSAKHDSMPRSAINTGLVDYVLPVEKIPAQIIKSLHYDSLKEGEISSELQQVFAMLRAHSGHDFSSYKLSTICRRVEKQMYLHKIDTLSEYVRFLQVHPQAIENLFKELLIEVTSFFRDHDAFESIKRVIIKLLRNKPDDYNFRVWVPGCSSGEEVYSIAMMIRECLDENKQRCHTQIFGTDIDLKALDRARLAIYPDTIIHDISTDRLKQFFIKEKHTFKIKKEVRDMVIFGENNIIKDPPFTKIDLICCRNLLIYLNSQLQKKLLPLFHYSLKPKGILFLGPSESIGGHVDLFRVIDRRWKIFERKDALSSPHVLINFPDISKEVENTVLTTSEKELLDERSKLYTELNKFLLEKYVPACVVTNKKGDIFYKHEEANHYLESILKVDSDNLFDVMNADLKIALKSTLRKANSQRKEIIFNNLHINNGVLSVINLKIIPIIEIEALQGMFFVIFENMSDSYKFKLDHSSNSTVKMRKQIIDLEQELKYTTENLLLANKELESSKERFQSTKEELLSTNEEIETSKEELNSLNEELIIVNTELQSRIDQLTIANDDMSNLFNSTEIMAVFLDNELCIKRYTPKAQELIHLLPSYIGQPISHFAIKIKYEKLIDDVIEVLKNATHKISEVQSKDEKWYLLKILPYKKTSGIVDGAIITFTDITLRKEAENKLNQYEKIFMLLAMEKTCLSDNNLKN